MCFDGAYLVNEKNGDFYGDAGCAEAIFMEALSSTSRNQPVIHNPRRHHQDPFYEQGKSLSVLVCVMVCVCVCVCVCVSPCPSLLSLQLLFFSLSVCQLSVFSG
ncbi:hypothetical protein AMECASPLE_010716 [Ameca splendens]|uniref:Uncharacterized protein n=1 Tax=Ameca splendens TaxID=208324 RepID=A0ABV0ZWZ9_9TELE